MTWPEIYSCKLDAESRAADLRDRLYAQLVELVDTLDLGSSAERFESSSLSLGTSVHYKWMFMYNEHMKIMNIYMVVIVLAVSTSVCGTDSMGSNPINHPKLEDCQSGL